MDFSFFHYDSLSGSSAYAAELFFLTISACREGKTAYYHILGILSRDNIVRLLFSKTVYTIC